MTPVHSNTPSPALSITNTVDLTDTNKLNILTKKVAALMSTIIGIFENIFGISSTCKGAETLKNHLDLKVELREDISLNKVFEKIIEQIAPERRPQIELRTTIDPNKTIEANETEIKQAADSIRLWMKSAANPSSDNQQVPAESPLNNITSLNLQFLSLTNIPLELNLLPNLSSLELNNNPIFYFPDSLELPNLKTLALNNTKILNLPQNLNICTPKLTTLLLSNSNLVSLPNCFHKLPHLITLDVGNTSLSSLPKKFNPPNLERLVIRDTQIMDIPDSFCAEHLQFFCASNTLLHDTPSSFKPTQLRSFNVSNTKIENLPDISTPKLSYLNLSDTGIKNLPDNWSLEENNGSIHIDIKNTNIESLPRSVSDNLKKINMGLFLETHRQMKLNQLRKTHPKAVYVTDALMGIGQRCASGQREFYRTATLTGRAQVYF